MLNSKYTKILLIAVVSASTLAAGFPEPFDMHCTIKDIVKEKLEAEQKKSSQNYSDHAADFSSSNNSSGTERESRNDNDSCNSQDNR
jgi:hypothetical protein